MIFNIRKETPKIGDIKVKEEFVLCRRIDKDRVAIFERVISVYRYVKSDRYVAADDEIWEKVGWELLDTRLPDGLGKAQIESIKEEYIKKDKVLENVGTVNDFIINAELYKLAIKEVEHLMDAKPNTPEYERLNALAEWVEKYEAKHYSIGEM